MGIVEKAKFWRRMGQLLDTGVGSRMAEAAGGLVNTLGAVATAPQLEDEVPWTPLGKSLAESTVVLISTAGFYAEGDQPFDIDAREGDPSFRSFSSTLDLGDLRLAHTHYSHRYVEQDANVLLPLERLRELESEGIFRLAPRTFSFGFGGRLTSAYIDPETGTAHRLAQELVHDEVDLALLVPA